MTAQDENQSSPEQIKLSFDGQSVDWYLQKLVTVVNTSTVQFGVTLFVEGAIVSGVLVSGKKYFETFAQEFSAAYPGDAEGKESIRQAFASHASIYDSENGEQTTSPPQFIHLIDSRHFSPGGQPLPNNRGVLWRGKINAVSGFSLGSLTADQA
ncbi:gas vesicle accessory protein GvpU [Xanthomonas sp. NCPPB 2654]|uniref:gas vesicle accessory protein GvpU n=1 Tax=unclassified Xanthomonas TaxID=2643310 RepID=UPI0021E02E70|nr:MULTISPECIES: gas vesicle accessory protein GvpU [unclassified Xanthomonas]MDL5367629.1 gas vesicle accessory protein GvpU [Xanthomonas sp. NCPPB 2654]UYC19239.1 gas vesicle protein [Xanthomonas sp. CFBP 8443]